MLVLNKPIMRMNAGSQVENNSKVQKIRQEMWQLSEGGAYENVAVKPNSMVDACLKQTDVTDGLSAV